eukprot:15366599-Ditylum_brightwellii.AAC.1
MPNQPSQEQIECLERTINEIDALQAIYGNEDSEEDETSSVCILSASELGAARSKIDGDDEMHNFTIPHLELQVKTSIDDGTIVNLKFSLPPGYPQEKAAVVSPSID